MNKNDTVIRAFFVIALAAVVSPIDCLAQDAGSGGRDEERLGISSIFSSHDWTGTYAGVQVGGAFGNSRRNFSPQGTSTGNFGTDGAIGGLTVGHNEQFGHVVAGLEMDFFGTSLTGNANKPAAYIYRTENPWFSTFRPRVGYALGNVLPYVTGGLSIGNEHVSSYTTRGQLGSDYSRTVLGWTVGTGVEAALSPSWSAKTEYLYVKPGDVMGPSSIGTPTTTTVSQHVLRLGLNYKFGAPNNFLGNSDEESSGQSSAPLTLGTLPGIEIGGGVSNYRYQEHSVPDTDLMHETGVKVGVSAAATETFSNSIFLIEDVRFAFSNNHYSSPGSGTQHDIPDYLFESRLLTGKDWLMSGPLSFDRIVGLSPYVGLGYRYLYNDMTGTASSGSKGYERYSQYLYIPVGITTRFSVTEDSRISVNTEYDQLIEGWQRSNLAEASPFFNNVTDDQYGGYGLRGSVMYEQAHWSVGPFFDYWNINRSTVDRSGSNRVGWEPHNQTIEYGLQARYRF